MINKPDNLSVNVKNNIDNSKPNKVNIIKQERKDEFVKSNKLSKEDTLFLNEIMRFFAKSGSFDDIANDLLTNDFWSDSIDCIKIYYEQEHVKHISVSGYTPETGERGAAVHVDEFLEKMDTVKQETIKKYPEKAQLCAELYSKLTDKLKNNSKNPQVN